jgi:2-polyprenyl-3-methyl-5-hydroxy-6-metoxy-1,4-benzoquinol methylase
MRFYLSGFLYQIIIDPLLSKLHYSVVENIKPPQRIIDVACGTGTLSIAMALNAAYVTGFDLSGEMINTARKTALKKGINNIRFELRDASDMSVYKDRQFDVAVTSMTLHQFDADLAIRIVSGMKRISSQVILADYNHHMPRGWGRSLSWSIERLAGGNHYRNFRTFMQQGGIHRFAREAGLKIRSEVIRGGGVFAVAVCGK